MLRDLPNRSEASVCGRRSEVAARLSFALRGVDSDNGGEFINHQLAKYLSGRTPPVAFTRSRPYRKNDQAHLEQKSFTNVRQWFGYERYDHAEVGTAGVAAAAPLVGADVRRL